MARRGTRLTSDFTAMLVALLLLGPLAIILNPVAARAHVPAADETLVMAAEPPTIVATTSILGDLAAQVAGGVAPVQILVGPGLEPHDFEPTPADAATLASADVVFANGLGLEVWLDDLIQNAGAPGLRRVNLSAGLPVIDQDPADPTSGNPHLWLDPTLAMAYVTTIRDTLIDLDPANQPAYETNAAYYLSHLRDLDNAIALEFAFVPADQRMLVTFHDAWPYFAARYGLRHIGIHPANPEGELTAQEYAETVDLLRREQVKVIFGEVGFNPKTMEQLARDTGVRFVEDLHSDGLAERGLPSTYVGMMQHNAITIAGALRAAA